MEPVAQTKVIVDDYRVNPNTGHIEVDVHCHSVDGEAEWHGKPRTYGVDLQLFRDKFAGDIAQFESWVAMQHRSIAGPPPGLANALVRRKGKAL